MLFFGKKKRVVRQICSKGNAVAKPRKFIRLSKVFIIFSLAILGLYACKQIYCFWQKHGSNVKNRVYSQPVKKIEFKSDGVLKPDWFSKAFPLKAGDIMNFDIFSIKNKLEDVGQIHSATIERKFPDTLKISICERSPILRVMVLDGKLKREMLVDADGVVFRGECFSDLEKRSMPFLSGTVLKKLQDGSFEHLPAMRKVYELLTLCKKKYWPIYAQIEVVSIEKLKKHKNVPWSQINLRCQFAKEVIFRDTDFDEQLRRLDFLITSSSIISRLPVERIDLTFGTEAIVKFAK